MNLSGLPSTVRVERTEAGAQVRLYDGPLSPGGADERSAQGALRAALGYDAVVKAASVCGDIGNGSDMNEALAEALGPYRAQVDLRSARSLSAGPRPHRSAKPCVRDPLGRQTCAPGHDRGV